MIDVGYFIDGRHGVIKNVSPASNPYTKQLVFTSVDCKEQYVIKREDVEYIIPHETNTKNFGKIVFDKDGIDGSVVMRGKYVEKPLTNAEKFKEVFGFEPNKTRIAEVCDMLDCRDTICEDCPYHNKVRWNDMWRGDKI